MAPSKRPILESAEIHDNIGDDKNPQLWLPMGGSVPLHPPKLIVGLSLTERDSHTLGHAPWFPATVDTGLTLNFLIDKDHLDRWAEFSLEGLKRVAQKIETEKDKKGNEIITKTTDLYYAKFWIHRRAYPRTEEGVRNVRRYLNPVPLMKALKFGVVTLAKTRPEPRVPLLGLRALTLNQLDLVVDGYEETFSILRSEPSRWQRFRQRLGMGIGETDHRA